MVSCYKFTHLRRIVSLPFYLPIVALSITSACCCFPFEAFTVLGAIRLWYEIQNMLFCHYTNTISSSVACFGGGGGGGKGDQTQILLSWSKFYFSSTENMFSWVCGSKYCEAVCLTTKSQPRRTGKVIPGHLIFWPKEYRSIFQKRNREAEHWKRARGFKKTSESMHKVKLTSRTLWSA